MPKGLTFLPSLVLAAALSMPIAAQAEPHADTVVATVNGEDITLGHLIVARESLPDQYRQLPAETLYDAMLDQLIQQVVLKQSLTKEPPQYVGLSLDNEERSQLAALVIEEVMVNAASEEEVRAAYDARFAEGTGGPEFDASHILVDTKEDALEIKKELDGGADFTEMAKSRSTGPSGPGGGGLGWFGEGQMVPEFESAVKSMSPGDVSLPVQTQFGWHLIKLNDKRLASAPAFEQVQVEILGEIQSQAVEDKITALVEAAEIDRPEVKGLTPQEIENVDLVRN
ncbi:MAG: peptidylprolyl isomerase [Paracoccaceae bacterium]|jgi:peptidyl-prolyl cis-trans isomerase C